MTHIEQATHGVKIARGVVTHWGDQPITSYEAARAALEAIEKHTGERGRVTRIYASLATQTRSV